MRSPCYDRRNIRSCLTVKSNLLDVGTTGYDEGVIITPSEVHDAIMKLGDNKACGMDNITAELMKHASKKLCPLLSLCFTGCLVHGTLPDSILAVLLVPVIKDNITKITALKITDQLH